METSDEKPRFWCILVAKFAGNYRPGHLGGPDAFFIQGITQTALQVWGPAALILDLRELSYTWGDDVDCVLSVGADRDLPTAIVGSGLCLPAIGTLVNGINSTTPATDAEHIFDTVEKAWDYVHQKA